MLLTWRQNINQSFCTVIVKSIELLKLTILIRIRKKINQINLSVSSVMICCIFFNSCSQICLSDPHRITTSFVIRLYLFLPSVFLCILPLYSDSLSNAINDCVLRLNILHCTYSGSRTIAPPSPNFFISFFSSPGPKVQVNYCHHLASVVCRLSSVVCRL